MAASPAQDFRKSLTRQVGSLHHEHDLYRWWVLANVMIGTFMSVLDATIVNVALPKIMATFGVSVDKAEWVITAYMLVFAVMLPTSGWLADHFGYKRTYFWSLFLFTLGSLLCGLSWNESALVFFRVIQGIGAGLMMPVGMAIVTREFPVEKRGMAMGFWSIAAAASVSFGPMMGGWLIDNFRWHAIFDVNVPVGILGMLATWIIQREYKTQKIVSFDLVGFVSLTVFLVSLLLALAEGNAAWNTGGWTSRFILSCFAISLVGLVVFLINEFSVPDPLIDLSLFRSFNFAVTNLVLFIFGLGMFGSTFLLPLYLQGSLGYTALQAGMVFLPVGILQGVSAPISGIMADKANPKIPVLIGIIFLAYSLYLNSFLSLYSEHYQIMRPLYIRGLAMGLMFAPLSTIALSAVPRSKIAQASGLLNITRQIGGSFGVAILGTLLLRRGIFHAAVYGQALNQYDPTFRHVAASLTHFVQQSIGGTLSEATTMATALIGSQVGKQALVEAINDDFLFAAIILALAIIPIALIRNSKPGPGKPGR